MPTIDVDDDRFEDEYAYRVYSVDYDLWPPETIRVGVGYCNPERNDLQMTAATETAVFMFGMCLRCYKHVNKFDDHKQCMWSAAGEYTPIPISMPGTLFHDMQKELKRESMREYNQRKSAAANAERKAKLDALGNRHTKAEVLSLFGVQKGRCYYCFNDLHDASGRPSYVKDHFTPVTHGGDDSIKNIVLTCRDCNGTKSNKFGDDFREFMLPKVDSTLRALLVEMQLVHKTIYWPRARPNRSARVAKS